MTLRRTKAPEQVMDDYEVTFTVTFEDGGKLTRKGQVWSNAPIPNGRWVIPYETDPRDLRGDGTVYCVRESRRGAGDFSVDLRRGRPGPVGRELTFDANNRSVS